MPLSLSLDLSLVVSLKDTLLALEEDTMVIVVSNCCWLLVSVADTVLVSLMLLPLHSVLGSTESKEPSECPER